MDGRNQPNGRRPWHTERRILFDRRQPGRPQSVTFRAVTPEVLSRRIADSLLTCSGLVCVLVGYIFASSAPGNLRLRQVNGAGPTLRQVLVHCPRQATSAASAATINAASAGC
jgi:hypothetical protein